MQTSTRLEFDFLGFTIRPTAVKSKDKIIIIPSIYVSQKSKNSLMEKFRTLKIHKRRTTLEEIAKMMNPILRGIINYYHKFRKNDLQNLWRQLNERLLKWVKWEKGLYKKAAVRYLKTKYKEKPDLFVHWLLVHP